MKILQVNTSDRGGGAEGVAWNLHNEYRRQGHEAWLAVGARRGNDEGQGEEEREGLLQIPLWQPRNPWAVACRAAARLLRPWAGKARGADRLSRVFQSLSEPLHFLRRELGHEAFDYPGARRLLSLPPERPDVVQCHNLHGPLLPRGGYFDLRWLPRLCRQAPVVMTLHDMWLATGHCAHTFDCERWKTGRLHCPDLTVYPAIRRDATARNWRVKQRIYEQSRFYVATPSLWLMRRIEQSMLRPAIVETRIIPNGVDLTVFHPGDKEAARASLDIPAGAAALLFAANGIRRNIWKDYVTLRDAIALASAELGGRDTLFIALGEDAPPETIGRARIRFVPYQTNPRDVARYYQAADLYLHAARVDTFPTTVIEALACGAPVVATDVGGIPEQVRDGGNGCLVAPQDSRTMANKIIELLNDKEKRRRMGEQAAASARARFSLDRQTAAYLNWFSDILRARQPGASSQATGGAARTPRKEKD